MLTFLNEEEIKYHPEEVEFKDIKAGEIFSWLVHRNGGVAYTSVPLIKVSPKMALNLKFDKKQEKIDPDTVCKIVSKITIEKMKCSDEL